MGQLPAFRSGRSPILPPAVSWLPLTQNNPHARVVYSGVAGSATPRVRGDFPRHVADTLGELALEEGPCTDEKRALAIVR